MRQEKTLIQEQAVESTAIQTSRSEPIQQAGINRNMEFIRNFILGIPTQELIETQESPQPIEDSSDLDLIKRLSGIK